MRKNKESKEIEKLREAVEGLTREIERLRATPPAVITQPVFIPAPQPIYYPIQPHQPAPYHPGPIWVTPEWGYPRHYTLTTSDNTLDS